MHACEMADGNVWQKKIAKLAIERLGPGRRGRRDRLRLQAASGTSPSRRSATTATSCWRQVDKLMPGDMPDFDPPCRWPTTALTRPQATKLATKHVIIISDGDPHAARPAPAGADEAATRSPSRRSAWRRTARRRRPEDGAASPRPPAAGAYNGQRTPTSCRPSTSRSRGWSASRSSTRSSSSRIVEFRSGPTERLPEPLPPLDGFVRTTPKPSPLVEMPILTPKFADQEFPLLAYWHYGLGKAVAFTSDAGEPARSLAGEATGRQGGIYAKFWEQVVDWSLRPTESGRLQMTTEYRDGKIHVIVEARDGGRQAGHDAARCAAASTPPRRRRGRAAAARLAVRAEEQRPVRGGDQGGGGRLVLRQRPGGADGEGQGQGRQGTSRSRKAWTASAPA